MLTYSELFQFCLVIIGIVGLVIQVPESYTQITNKTIILV